MLPDYKESPNEVFRTQPFSLMLQTYQHCNTGVVDGSAEYSENMKFLLSLGDSELKMKELKQSADHIILILARSWEGPAGKWVSEDVCSIIFLV